MTRPITNFSYLFIQIDVTHVYDALMDMIGDESLITEANQICLRMAKAVSA